MTCTFELPAAAGLVRSAFLLASYDAAPAGREGLNGVPRRSRGAAAGAGPRTQAADPGAPAASASGSGADGTGADGPGAAGGAGASANGWQPAAGGPPAPPAVSLPKGGGAIRDIGEKFSVSAATGTASLTVPVATSPGRAGFGPSLSLQLRLGLGQRAVRPGLEDLDYPPSPARPTRACRVTSTTRTPTRSSWPAPRTWSRSGPSGTAAGGRCPPGGPRAAGTTWCRATGPGSRACSPGSSAGATWAPARRTGARSPAPTSPRSTARPRPAASPTRPTRPACSAG